MAEGWLSTEINKRKGLAGKKGHALFVNFAGLEKMPEKERRRRFGNKDVIMCGYAGLAGSVLLAEKKEQELLSRYAAFFIENAKKQKMLLWQIPEAAPAGESDDCEKYSFSEKEIAGMYLLSEGGVFAGLWNMAEETGVGLEIDLKKIPIKQETIEICNFLNSNPYQLYAEGSCLILTDYGGRLRTKLRKKGIVSEVIGITTENRDRVVVNGEEGRFLEKHYEEALYKVLPETVLFGNERN